MPARLRCGTPCASGEDRLGINGRDLLGDRDCEQLIERAVSALGQNARSLEQRIRQAKCKVMMISFLAQSTVH